MKYVLDTDILIDILRGYAPAIEWFSTLTELPAIISLCVMELVQGCRNRNELNAVQQLVAPLEIWYPNESEMRAATDLFIQHYLRNRLSIVDAIVGAVVVSRSAVLCTFNTRHYPHVADSQMMQPYLKDTGT